MGYHNTFPKKLRFLRSSLSEHRQTLSRRITEEIQYSDNPKAIRTLLQTIVDIGDAALMKKWNGMLSDVQTRSVKSRINRENAGLKEHGSSKSRNVRKTKKGDSPASDPATGKPGSSAVENVAYIAQQVARRIEDLKDKYPNLGAFSAAKHLRKTPTHAGFAPGTPSNPELFSISYHNGVLGRKASPKDGKKRATEFIYDRKIGVHLYVHFFKGDRRGNDLRVPNKIGNLSVHLSVKGPAADAIRTDIEPILDALRSRFGPNGLKGSNNPDAQPMVVYSERRKRRSAAKVRLTVQNNHALRAPDAKSELADDLIEKFSIAKYFW